eukprot:16431212-Heterocapsa_arctica.AAC.1
MDMPDFTDSEMRTRWSEPSVRLHFDVAHPGIHRRIVLEACSGARKVQSRAASPPKGEPPSPMPLCGTAPPSPSPPATSPALTSCTWLPSSSGLLLRPLPSPPPHRPPLPDAPPPLSRRSLERAQVKAHAAGLSSKPRRANPGPPTAEGPSVSDQNKVKDGMPGRA